VVEGAGAGADTVQSSVSFTLGANVEKLVLTGVGAVNATGNALANSLIGNGNSNRLDGGAGADSMAGGLGHDSYVVDHALDKVVEGSGAGADTVQSSVSLTLGAHVENLGLTGTGAVNGTGNALANSLAGNGNSNRLDGGAGADSMAGGAGHDRYVVDHALDKVVEGAGAGSDTVQSSVSFTLGANVENLALTGAGAINGTGNAFANILTGNGNSNRLDGGAGADTMNGGLGHDIYVVDNAGDKTMEAAGAGTDTVLSAVSFALGSNVENLTLTGTGTTHAAGNALANVLTGNGNSNRLDGGGGADTMTGGLGHDVYVVDNVGDKAIEAAGAGSDTVLSSVSFTLGANVDNLVLTGAAAVNGTGNTLANALTGNGAANVLNGGAGADTMQGGGGGDVLVGGEAGDRFVYRALSDSTAAAADLIVDFGQGDRIDLSAIDAAAATAGDQAFHLGATAGHVGDVLVSFDAANNRTAVSLYVNGDALADAMIWLAGNHLSLTSADFLF
jgi:Ca2+-binding RTX toxin-like protein